jgi:hypothetical protein
MPPAHAAPPQSPVPTRPSLDGPEQSVRGHSRRSFLRGAGLAGGTALVVSAGGLSYRAYDQGVFEAGEGGAYDAWRDWEQGRGPLALVSAAILAANPHNSQAWVFRTTPSSIDLFADRERSTGTLDPFDREMYVGLGCALENLLQAAPAHGYRARLALLPTPGEPVHAARVELTPGPRRRAALYRAIPERHTDRSAYGAQALPQGALAQITALAGGLPGARVYWFSGDADRARVGALMVDAARAITRDDQQSRDSFRLFRSSWDDIQKHKDGLTLDAQGLSALTTAVAKLLPASDRGGGDKFWVDQTRKTHTRTAARHWRVALLVICGAYYVFLGATALGLAGLLGILGGVLICAAARAAPRSPRTAYALLLAGALPFATATWWSIVTPVIAALSIVIGRGVIRHTRRAAAPQTRSHARAPRVRAFESRPTR